ncbi:MAG: prolipoprotein diacylglyceryl transferase [Candidatus Eremiobacteraeota bacterium]|nr:prolipoprotein diacylglyceryl transferase [Candidatus Eremiobacteraeota bacterium]
MDALPVGLRLGLSALAYVVAYGAGLALFVWAARRRGFAEGDVRKLAVAALIGGLVGASVLQLAIGGEPGKTILGGIAGGWIAINFAKRELGIRRPTGDAFAFAIAGGEAIGRVGCFIAGCCYGKLASVPWAVHDHGELRHPTQLYSALAALLTLAVITMLDRRRVLPEGGIFFVQGALFCALRFLIEFYREVPAYGGFSLAQYACVAGFIFFVWKLRGLLKTSVAFA